MKPSDTRTRFRGQMEGLFVAFLTSFIFFHTLGYFKSLQNEGVIAISQGVILALVLSCIAVDMILERRAERRNVW